MTSSNQMNGGRLPAATGDGNGPEVDVGSRLRELRKSRGFSIRSLAERSGLSANTLSLIENNKTSPSVSTLRQVASALGIPITDFFHTGVQDQQIIFQKAGRRPSASFSYGILEDLSVGIKRRGIESFIVNLQPGGGSGSTPIVHTGLELVVCLEGRIEYRIDGQSFILEPQDSLLFEAHLPHSWRNADTTPSRSLLVMCPSDQNDRPKERHFTG